jgi:anti-sigma factor RsiW
VIAFAHHLHEERLFDCYLTARSGETIDPPAAEHLADCTACAARYTELAAFMEGLQHDAEAEADAVFTPDRLRAQQQQIERRLALVRRPARVISFPGQFVRRTISASTSHTAPRWIAAAAAAGLFIGVAVGAGYGLRVRPQISPRFAADAARTGRLTPVATRGDSPAEVASDDAFLSDLEIALERPHTRELQAFDAFTPHVREVRAER